MTAGAILAFLTGLFQFFPEVRALILLLSKSSEEKRQAISDQIQLELKNFEDTNRP